VAPNAHTMVAVMRTQCLLWLALLVGISASIVPEQPAAASLQVISNTELELNFLPPSSDGGSEVTSYLVEWDTDPGVTEIQTITSATYIGANEIISFTSSANDVDEVQLVSTHATTLLEIQQITTSAIPFQTLGGEFALAFDTTTFGGSMEISGVISHGADAKGSRDAVKEILESMANIGEGGIFDVSRVGPDSVNGFSWLVTFASHMRNVPPLYLYSSSLTGTGADVAFSTEQEGNILDGYFTLEYDGHETKSINHDASANDMKEALELLPSIGSVDITRTDTYVTDQGGYQWSVTFTDRANSKDLNMMSAKWNNLVGEGSNVDIIQTQQGSELSGSFNVRVGTTWGTISHNASAADVKHVIENLPEVLGSLEVKRSMEDDQGGYVWTARFLSPQDEGDVDDFEVDYADLNAAGGTSNVVFEEVRKGSIKEVQVVSIVTDGVNDIGEDTFFQLTMTDGGGRSATTGNIPANVAGVCDPVSREVQRISCTSSNIVSPFSKFRLLFDGEATEYVFANPLENGDCRIAAEDIRVALEELDTVSGTIVVDADPADELSANPAHECSWTITFQGMSGNLPEMTIATTDSDLFDFTATSSHPGNLVDTFTIETVEDGAWNIVKTELEKLVTVGQVTVTSVGPTAEQGCQWAVKFDTHTNFFSCASGCHCSREL